MAVKKRKLPNRKLSENFYYRFKINGKEYKGSTYTSNKKEAVEYEESVKADLKGILKSKDTSDKVQKRNLINFRDKITNQFQGDSIPIDEIWETFTKKAPAKMKKIPDIRGWKEKNARWEDFHCFIKSEYADCKTMIDIIPAMAEEYISLIKTSGKFRKTISCKGSTYKSKAVRLSASTINKYIGDMNQIFRILSSEAKLFDNPFQKVQRAKDKPLKRDVFEIHELKKIKKFIDESQDFKLLDRQDKKTIIILEAVFTIGINSGLRKGDICLLKWGDVNFRKKAIETTTHKTGEKVFIPLTQVLNDFLVKLPQSDNDDYVLPELAQMYQTNEEGISYRFKKMLKELKIESSQAPEGRSRRVSSKDIHSLRHTFCYLHGIQGTPLVVVQSMVGHMNKKMTESYMMHQTEELKREAIDRFSLKPFSPTGIGTQSETKKQLLSLIKNCTSEDFLNRVLEFTEQGLLENKSSNFE